MALVTKKLLENCFLALLDSGMDYRKKLVGCYTAGNSIDLPMCQIRTNMNPRGSFAGGGVGMHLRHEGSATRAVHQQRFGAVAAPGRLKEMRQLVGD
ncbi:hypothetical protein B0H19DRAFT_189328 [Mycena capillaripes]|nr:hypothetical protein B0H19DRAFT_189328 [Mycena capillaripes]